MRQKSYSAIIVAGGTGSRMQAKGTDSQTVSVPKQFLPLAGKPVLFHTLQKFLDFDPGLAIVLVIHPATKSLWEVEAPLHLSVPDRARIFPVSGGASRTASVSNGIQTMVHQLNRKEDHLVAIHDAVRPFVTHTMLAAAYHLAASEGSAVCCVPVKSSMRMQLDSSGTKAVDRSRFFHVQTPQVFSLGEIARCYEGRPHDNFTDDATLLEEMGGTVHICEGSYDNIKLTTPEDMAVAEEILRKG